MLPQPVFRDDQLLSKNHTVIKSNQRTFVASNSVQRLQVVSEFRDYVLVEFWQLLGDQS
jgi:hypothetical protein